MQPELGDLSDERARKLAGQRNGARAFWEKAKLTKEDKRITLATANEAREKATSTQVTERQYRKLFKLGQDEPVTMAIQREVSYEDLESQVKAELDRAEQQQQKRTAEHGRTDAALTFLNDFLNFVGEFSGVVEIMKAADESYGGAAYTALSVFLAVAVNTKRKDDMIANAMIRLREHYSRMVIISEIYPTPEMRRYITNAYALGLQFVVEARVYYTRSVWRE
ncbi:hypothetical protein LQW54_001358 [Pestalotiopsis sp. IQ-011]